MAHPPTDTALDYERPGAATISPQRRKAARHLVLWAILLLVFASIAGFVVFDTRVVERVLDYRFSPDGFSYHAYLRRVYHWRQLVWVGAVMGAPLAVATAYWLLAKHMRRRADRSLTFAALSLTVLHTLAASLCFFLAVVMGWGMFVFEHWTVVDIAGLAGAILVLLMVPGVGYLCVLLMDLTHERVIVKRPAPQVAMPVIADAPGDGHSDSPPPESAPAEAPPPPPPEPPSRQ